jgi:hypothetical protein
VTGVIAACSFSPPCDIADQQPGKQETQQHAAIVTKEDACATVARVAQVVIEETADAAHQGNDENDTAGISTALGDNGGQPQADQAHRTRQSIDPVDHVEGVDQADGGENGQWNSQPTELNAHAREQFSKRTEFHSADKNHRQSHQRFHQETRLEAEVPEVIGKTGQENDQRHQRGSLAGEKAQSRRKRNRPAEAR